MFKFYRTILSLFVMIFLAISCGSNQEVVQYNINEKVVHVSVQKILKDFRQLYPQIDPQMMSQVISNEEYLKMAILNRIIEPDLFKKEALEIADYAKDSRYIASLKMLEDQLPYVLGLDKARGLIMKQLDKQKADVAEVSCIMFTRSVDQKDEQKAYELLDQLKSSTSIEEDFARFAEEHTKEYRGSSEYHSRYGGYLGEIVPEQYSSLDKVIFQDKQEGLVSSVITDEKGSYIVFVHTPSRKVSISKLMELGATYLVAKRYSEYILKNVKVFCYINEGGEIILNGKVISDEALLDTTKIVEMWGKSYSIKDLKPVWSVVVSMISSIENRKFLQGLLLPGTDSPNKVLINIATIFKGYSSSIINTKEYKKLLAHELNALQLRVVYEMISEEMYKGMDTEVLESELKSLYDLQIKDNSTEKSPISFQDAKAQLKEMVLQKRSELIQQEYRGKMASKYAILWNEKGFSQFINQLTADYGKYSKKIKN